MKIQLINGCEANNVFYEDSIKKICEYMSEKKMAYNLINLNALELKGCIACDYCQNIKPGICVINDGVNDILKEYINSDLAVIITPIRFGSCNSITKKLLDRTQPLYLPYQISQKGRSIMKNRYEKYPDLIFVGISDNAEAASVEVFKNTFMTCNLAEESNKVRVQIIKGYTDLEEISFLG